MTNNPNDWWCTTCKRFQRSRGGACRHCGRTPRRHMTRRSIMQANRRRAAEAYVRNTLRKWGC